MKLYIVVNVDWFFLSHRLPIALAAKDAGYEVTILACDTGNSVTILKYGLNFIHVPFERSGTNIIHEFKCLNILKKLYKENKPDLVHHVTMKVALYGTIAAKLASISNIVNAISGLGYNFIGTRNGPIQFIVKKLMNFAFKNGVNFIFQNPDDLLLFKQMGYLRTNRYTLIKGAGVNGEVFQYTSPLEKEKLHVVLTARMLKDKGVFEYVEAAKILSQRWKGKVIFRLIGDLDPINPAGITAAELKEREIKDYIIWEGFNANVHSVLIDSDIVCLPSYREGLPKSLIEAMAIGRPIVTTDVPGCRECVQENFNGFLVCSHQANKLAAAIEILLLDPGLRLKMGKNSRLKMEQELSMEKVLKDTLSFYREVS